MQYKEKSLDNVSSLCPDNPYGYWWERPDPQSRSCESEPSAAIIHRVLTII